MAELNEPDQPAAFPPPAPVFTLPAATATNSPPSNSPTAPIHAAALLAIPQKQKKEKKRGFGVPLTFALLLVAAGGVAFASPLGDRFRDTKPEPTMATMATLPTTTAVPTASVLQIELMTTTTVDYNTLILDHQARPPLIPDDAFARIEECRSEAAIVFVSLQNFVYQTGAHPEHPDGLANINWLEAHPDGWNSRWAFEYSDEGIRVVPTVGGSCDFGG